jgi:hypothetical protein
MIILIQQNKRQENGSARQSTSQEFEQSEVSQAVRKDLPLPIDVEEWLIGHGGGGGVCALDRSHIDELGNREQSKHCLSATVYIPLQMYRCMQMRKNIFVTYDSDERERE